MNSDETGLVGKRVTAVMPLSAEVLDIEDWYSEHVESYMLLLEDRTRVYASRDVEGNGPGCLWFAGGPVGGRSDRVFTDRSAHVVGQTIVEVRPPTKSEYARYGFEYDRFADQLGIQLSNGVQIVAGSDAEGNGAGALFLLDPENVPCLLMTTGGQ